MCESFYNVDAKPRWPSWTPSWIAQLQQPVGKVVHLEIVADGLRYPTIYSNLLQQTGQYWLPLHPRYNTRCGNPQKFAYVVVVCELIRWRIDFVSASWHVSELTMNLILCCAGSDSIGMGEHSSVWLQGHVKIRRAQAVYVASDWRKSSHRRTTQPHRYTASSSLRSGCTNLS